MTMTSMTMIQNASMTRMLRLCALAGAFALVSAPVSAQEQGRRAPLGLIDTILQGPKLRTDPGEPADWVKARRPSELQELVRVQPGAEPARKLLTPDEIRQREAQLDAVRIRNEQLGGRQPVRGNFASAAGTPQEKKKKVEVHCVITCDASSGVKQKKR